MSRVGTSRGGRRTCADQAGPPFADASGTPRGSPEVGGRSLPTKRMGRPNAGAKPGGISTTAPRRRVALAVAAVVAVGAMPAPARTRVIVLADAVAAPVLVHAHAQAAVLDPGAARGLLGGRLDHRQPVDARAAAVEIEAVQQPGAAGVGVDRRAHRVRPLLALAVDAIAPRRARA